MRITNSSVSMSSNRSYQAESEISQTIIDRRYNANDGLQQTSVSVINSKSRAVEIDSGASVFINVETDGLPSGQTQTGRKQQNQQSAPVQQTDSSTVQNAPDLQSMQSLQPADGGDWLSDIMEEIDRDPVIQMMRKALDILERFTGKKYSNNFPSILSGDDKLLKGSVRLSASAAALKYQSAMAMAGVELSGERGPVEALNGYWTRQTVQSAFVRGEEHTAFASAGTAVTADGRTIDFGISVEMSRSFEEKYDLVSEEAVYTDPLVINLDTDAASLSDVTFYFDLDGDGQKEELSGLGAGSGFLALDKNGDGVINDGSELFGAKTGNGFAELAQFDQDGNGWIDEGDEIFSKLSVWVKAGSGDAKLISLADAGVGAVFLGSQATQFSLADSGGNVNAVVRRSGVYLKENGQVGTVQHVDFIS